MSAKEEVKSEGFFPRDQVNSLKHFQQHSRLHFIGQWKTRAHDIFKELFEMHPSWNHGTLEQQALFVHLDMDAFFCSVALAKDENASLRDKPVCIAAGKYNSDVSSCNYVARSFGVHSGMYVNAAKHLCPDLRVLHYDLPRCESVITCLYSLLYALCPAPLRMAVEVYSIDEVVIAFDAADIALVSRYCGAVRAALERRTRCTASCGVAPNVMAARVATAAAKPNGVRVICAADVPGVIAAMPFEKIHGAGRSTMAKLRPLVRAFVEGEEGEILCRHVQKLSKAQLKRALGEKAGETFYNFARGVDTRQVTRTGDVENQHLLGKKHPSSVSCSMNYAVRPGSLEDVWRITSQLLEDVCSKLSRGKFLTTGLRLTLLERHPLAPKETQKFMGRGKCVEFHIPVVLENPLGAGDFGIMTDRVKCTLSPILVTSRSSTDAERASELALVEDANSPVIWTVHVPGNARDVVISDIRGMTLFATGLYVEDLSNKAQKGRKSEGQQLSLLKAFSRGAKKSQEKSVEVVDASLSPSAPAKSELVRSSSSCCYGYLEDMMYGDVDGTFIEEWKEATRLAVQQLDYPAIKTLLRVAAFRCSAGTTIYRETFTELEQFTNNLLPLPVAFF